MIFKGVSIFRKHINLEEKIWKKRGNERCWNVGKDRENGLFDRGCKARNL